MKMRIKYKMLSPVSHIGETASTGSYFQTILTDEGRVPVITGNSIRGQLRDNMALHLLDLLGVKVSKDTFNILFSGGNINGTMKDDVEKAKKVREAFPFISLMGGGLGDMIMAGKLICSFAYPVCRENSVDLQIIGMRKNESARRRATLNKRGLIYQTKSRKSITCCPIGGLTDEDIWAYIFSNGLEYLSIYDYPLIDRRKNRNEITLLYNDELIRRGEIFHYKQMYPDFFAWLKNRWGEVV